MIRTHGHVFRGWGAGRVNTRRLREFRELIRDGRARDLVFEKRPADRMLIVRYNRVEQGDAGRQA